MMCSKPAWERAKRPTAATPEEEEVLGVLHKHLQASSLYDGRAVIAASSKADLFEELVIVHRKVYPLAIHRLSITSQHGKKCRGDVSESYLASIGQCKAW